MKLGREMECAMEGDCYFHRVVKEEFSGKKIESKDLKEVRERGFMEEFGSWKGSWKSKCKGSEVEACCVCLLLQGGQGLE